MNFTSNYSHSTINVYYAKERLSQEEMLKDLTVEFNNMYIHVFLMVN